MKPMKIQNTDSTWFTETADNIGTAFSLATTTLLHQEKSAYQNIEIYETKTFGNLMVLDGFIMLTTRDNFLYHEMMSHPALFSHSHPKHVAIVGGGDCGTLQQVALHSCVEKITQIEIDERVTRVSEQYFPELCTSNNDPRAKFEFYDAINWMQNAPENSIDIIIVDSTDPIGPAEGLFQKQFYQYCWSALSENGLVIQQSESPLVHWESITKPMHNEMQAAGFNQTKTLFFPQPVYPTGWWSATMAAKSDIHLIRDRDAKNLTFDTKYYNYDIHLSAFAMPSFLKS
jgi:spermidine synthase